MVRAQRFGRPTRRLRQRPVRRSSRRLRLIGLEPHQQYSKTIAGLDRIYGLVESPAIGINFDTGNSYLAGEDPYRWLERVAGRLVHLHAKDISIQHSAASLVHDLPAQIAVGRDLPTKWIDPRAADHVYAFDLGRLFDYLARVFQHLLRDPE